MAISRIGTGWPVEDRDFATIALWNTARGGSGDFEEGIMRGSVTTGNTTINGAFSAGALLRGFVEYDGSNLSEIATTGGNHLLRISSNDTIVRDLRVVRSNNFSFPAFIDGDNSFFERCYLRQDGTGNAGVVDLNNAATNKGLRNCVVVGNGNANYIQTGFGRDFTIASCIGVGYPTGSVTLVSSGATTVLRDSFFAENTGETYSDPSEYNTFLNNASADGTGTVTGYTTAEFVDFANEDYRIKSTSDLFAFGIGAFFEEGGGAVEITPETGVYSYAGGDVDLLINRAIQTDSGVYSYQGGNVSITKQIALQPETGLFNYVGGDIDLLLNRAATPQAGVFSYQGGAVEIIYDADTSITINPQTGIFSYQGGSVDILVDRLVSPETGVYQYLGGDVEFTVGKTLTPLAGVFSYLGGDVQITLDRAINPETGSYSYAGGTIIIAYSGQVIRRVTNYSVNYEQDYISAGYERDYVSAQYEDIR